MLLHEQSSIAGWIAMPDEVEAKILEWQDAYPDIVSLETVTQYVGLKVYAVTVTGAEGDPARKKKMIVHVPHAHEPGATAGCMDFLGALITGEHLDGRPFELARDQVLRDALVTVIPDCNPDGRSRAPVRYWDGSMYTNDEFWAWMRGKDRETGKMWKRLGLWSTKVETDHPEPVGIVYEQISDHEYVEPNRTHHSSLWKLFKRHIARHPYDQMVSVHQTEFQNSPYNAMVILPCLHDELSPERQAQNMALGEAIVEAWREVGAEVIPDVKPLGYTGEQREYFVNTWGTVYETMTIATTEVQNNNPRTPPEEQMLLCETGIRAAVAHLLTGGV